MRAGPCSRRSAALLHRALSHDGRRTGRSARGSADAQARGPLSQGNSRRRDLRERIMRIDSADEARHDRRDNRARHRRSHVRWPLSTPRKGTACAIPTSFLVAYAPPRLSYLTLSRLTGPRQGAQRGGWRRWDLKKRLKAVEDLAAETFENYKNFVNPPLARVMKLSGSPVEVRASGTTIWDQTGKAYLDFAGRLRRLHAGTFASARGRRGARADRTHVAFRARRCSTCARTRGAAAWRNLRRAICRSRFGATAAPKRSKARSNSRAPRPGARRSSERSTRITARRSARSRSAGAKRSKRRFVRCSPTRRTFRTAMRRCSTKRCATRRHSSSNRCKAKAASTCRRWVICARCARRAIVPAHSLSPTKCRPGSGAAATVSRANATASSPT
jgi:hypothetical protein